MSNVLPEADDYDLTAFNEHIKQATEREKAITLDIRLKALQNNLPKIMWWFFIGAVIASFVFIAIGLAIRLAVHPEKLIQPKIPKEFNLNLGDLRVGIDTPLSANVRLDSENIENILSSYNNKIYSIGSKQQEIFKQIEVNGIGIKSLTKEIGNLSDDLISLKKNSYNENLTDYISPYIEIDPKLPETKN